MDKQEAIKILKNFHDTSALFSVRTALETVLPELEESEDEKIREAILNYFTKCWGNCKDDVCGIHVEDAISWLEKQRKPIDDNIITHDDEILQAISIGLTDAVEDLGWSDFGGLPIEEIQEWLEKKGEQRPIIEMKSPEESLGISPKEYNDVVNECLYGEENPANKVKPKFHEGDWVVDSLVDRVNQVQSIDKYGYNFNNGDFTSFDCANENFRLWTIQDARDGNILVDDCGNVLIYQEPSTDGYYHSYCYCNEMTFIGQGGSHGIEHSHPANQRQRELLFQKMDEAHYEWDAENRELKKIDTISNACEAVESENEMAKAALFFIENCKDYFACNGVGKIDVINWFKETFYGK